MIAHKVSRQASYLCILTAVLIAGCSEPMPTSEGAVSRSSAGLAAAVAPASDDAIHTYHVTIENLTETQPFSPGVLATHTMRVSLFEPGAFASEGIRLIAEEGNPTEALAELHGRDDVHDVINTAVGVADAGPGPILAGESKTYEIEALANANRLSAAVMIICSNDGFVGLDSVKLPRGFKEAVFYANGYDAGTEQNTQASEDLVDVPLCGLSTADGNGRTATQDVIMHHSGINESLGDLTPAQHGWSDPMARVTVKRIW